MHSEQVVRSIIDRVSEDRIRNHVKALEGVRHPVTGPGALARAATYIEVSLESLGYPVRRQSFIDHGRPFDNILATREGLSAPDDRVLVIAHFDTVSNSPGADDNASGVAALMELADVLGERRYDRTVQFVAVNLEESDAEESQSAAITRGSRALAQHANDEGWNITAAIVFEMVGFADSNINQRSPAGLPIRLREKADFIGVVGNEDSKDLVATFCSCIDSYGISLPYQQLVVPGKGHELPDVRRSDHAPFWDAGYRALMITDTAEYRNENYHRESDTIETLNLGFAANVCRAAAAMVCELAIISS
jgi:hypothetical protein